MDDKQIIALLWNRAEAAIEALRRRFGGRLQSLALHILGDPRDAEETVSDTYLAVWNAIPPNRPDPLAGYVCKIGRNLALKRLRYQTAEKRFSGYDLSLEELAGCIPAPALEERADARALGRSISRFLMVQSQENRVLFLRRYWFGDSVAELAAALGMRENAIHVRLSRLRGKLRDYLIKEGYDHV